MKLLRISIITAFLILLGLTVNAEEKKIKLRGIDKAQEFKQVQINVSPDLLKFDKLEKLKSNYETAEQFALETDKNLIKKKKIKYRGTAKSIYKNYASSVVFLYNPTEGKESLGAGFLVDKSGVILTNWHVTNGAKNIYVWPLPAGGSVETNVLFKDINPYVGLVIAENKTRDLALIKVSGLDPSVKAVDLGNNADLEIGDTVYAIGHPNGLPWSFTNGMVTQIRKNKKWVYDDEFEHSATVIQTQTPISPGNSGGPLFSENGKIVGINTWGAEGQNLNFAVAVDHAKQFIKGNPDIKSINTAEKRVKKTFPNAISQDYNKNGIIDTWYIDTDKNGKIDLALVDDDEDGFIEGHLFDKNENGVFEYMELDTDKDGKINIGWFDRDEDKEYDVKGYDYNQDGEWDKIEKI